MTLHLNIVGSARNEGYDLPAYLDVAFRGRFNWPSGSVKRFRLPRILFRKTHTWKVGN